MDVPEASEQAPAPFLFSSEAGHALCRCMLMYSQGALAIQAQIESICKTFDKIDLFAVLPTGSGKTIFLPMYMLVVLAIQKDPSLCPIAKFLRGVIPSLASKEILHSAGMRMVSIYSLALGILVLKGVVQKF